MVAWAVVACGLAAAPARSFGAVLTGRGGDAIGHERRASRWQLDGRHLLVRFRQEIVDRRRVLADVVCGDDAVSGGPQFFDPQSHPVWARSTHAWVWIYRRQRRLQVTFARDVSHWANLCAIEASSGGVLPKMPMLASLAPLRGRGRGCALDGRERVVLRTGVAQLTRVANYNSGPFVQEGGLAYRACLRGSRAPIPIVANLGLGGSAAGTALGPFALGGSWVAWSILDFGPGAEAPEPINLLDLRRPTRPVSIAPEVPPGRQGDEVVKELAVSHAGAVAWTLWITNPFPRYQVLLHTPAGSERVLAESNRPTLFKPRFTLDAATISWTSDGRPDSATVGP